MLDARSYAHNFYLIFLQSFPRFLIHCSQENFHYDLIVESRSTRVGADTVWFFPRNIWETQFISSFNIVIVCFLPEFFK